jgi:hypothetical protein
MTLPCCRLRFKLERDGCQPREVVNPGTLNRETFPRESIHTEMSPLRWASVEMTKGRAVLPVRGVAEQKPFSSPCASDYSPLSSRPKRSAVEGSLCGCSLLGMFLDSKFRLLRAQGMRGIYAGSAMRR